jgi:hypothetical protein
MLMMKEFGISFVDDRWVQVDYFVFVRRGR